MIGTPSEAEMEFLNENAKRYIRQLPLYRRQSFTEKFPHVNPAAIDLVEKMLTFDPRRRITGAKFQTSLSPSCINQFSICILHHFLCAKVSRCFLARDQSILLFFLVNIGKSISMHGLNLLISPDSQPSTTFN